MTTFDVVADRQAEPEPADPARVSPGGPVATGGGGPVAVGLAVLDDRVLRLPSARAAEGSHGHGAGCSCETLRRTADAGSDATGAVIGWEGGQVDQGTERLLRASAGAGSPLSPALRAPIEGAFGADFSGVRLHAGTQAATLNQQMSAEAFTFGQDIYFRDGLPDTSTDQGLHLLSHELTHTVQQGAVRRTVQRKAVVGHVDDPVEHEADRVAESVVQALRHGLHTAPDTPTHGEPVVGQVHADQGIHRHAAYEHYLLGQLQPREIKALPAVRKVWDNSKQTKRLLSSLDAGQASGLQRNDKTQLEDAKHLIDREMERLLAFRKDPDALQSRIGEKGQVSKGGGGLTDDEYQVPIVVLSCADGEQLVVSYSEMNTMPDFFGNPEAIGKTPKSKVLGILQGVRQQLYLELNKIRVELGGTDNNALHHTILLDEDFQGARGPRAQAVVDGVYELMKESELNNDTTRQGDETEQYFAALERNACHFAPASWQQWRAYHEEARRLASESAAAAKESEDAREEDRGDEAVQQLADLARTRANEAMVQNSFGEHYLQDSFAAGHLIDKTQIMQWFTQWADKDKGGMGSTASGKAAWSMALHAANSDLTSNPQRLHDKAVRDELKGPQDAAAEIGMDVGGQRSQDIVLMMRWRALAQATPARRTLTLEQARGTFGKGDGTEALLESLVGKRFVRKDVPWEITRGVSSLFGRASETKYVLDQEMVNVLGDTGVLGGTRERRGKSANLLPGAHLAYAATRGKGATDQDGEKTGYLDEAEAEAAAAEFNLASYNSMLSNAFVGAATKHFHDMFCKQGLVVKTGGGTDIGRIYGDANMLNAGGQKGVEHSAETSRMSRTAVFDLISGKQPASTVADIEQRFPTEVYYDGRTALPLVSFNKKLEALIKDESAWLIAASSNKARLGYKAMDGISGKGALDVAAMSADHGGPF